MVSRIFYFHPYLGKWSNLTNILQMGWNHQPDSHYDLHLSDSLLATTHQKVSKKPSSAMKLQFPPQKQGLSKVSKLEGSHGFPKKLSCLKLWHLLTQNSTHIWWELTNGPLQNRLCKDDMLELPWRCWRLTSERRCGGPTDGYDSSCRGCIPIRLNIFFSSCGINILRADC